MTRDGGSGEGTGCRAGDCRAGSEVEAWGDSSAVRGRLVRLRRRRKRQEKRRAGVRGFPAALCGRRGAYGVRGCGMGDGGGANRRGGACQRRSEGSGLIPFFGEMRGKGGREKRCVCGTEAAGEGTGRGRERRGEGGRVGARGWRRAGRKARERRGGACAPEQEIPPGRGVSPRADRISGSRNLYPQRCCAGCRGQDLRNMGECRRGMPRESFEFHRRQGLL